VIAALIPPERVITNAAPYLYFSEEDHQSEAYLLGILCSTPLDWYARRFVEINLNYFIFNKFPVPMNDSCDDRCRRVAEVSGRLAAVDDRYASWAEAVGVPVGSVTTQTEKDDLVAELDAVVAHLYGLDADDLEVIWDTFHTTVNRLPSLDKVLGFHETWAR
jgi:hypothetical protein